MQQMLLLKPMKPKNTRKATKMDIKAVADLDDMLPNLDQVSQLPSRPCPLGQKSMSSGMAMLGGTTSAACSPTATLVNTTAPAVETAAATDAEATQHQV